MGPAGADGTPLRYPGRGAAVVVTGVSGTYSFVVAPHTALTRKLSFDMKQATLKDVLEYIAAEQNVTWKVAGNNTIKISAVK